MFFLEHCMDNHQTLQELLEKCDNTVRVYTDLQNFPMKIHEVKEKIPGFIVPEVKLSDTLEKIAKKIKE